MNIVPTIAGLVQHFRPAFSGPAFAKFAYIALAWVVCERRPTITNFIRTYLPDIPGLELQALNLKHFSTFHRFFTRDVWDLDHLGFLMAARLGSWLDEHILLIIDDSLFRRSGPRILGAGMHHDPLRSTMSGKTGRRHARAWGINFVVLSVWVRAHWLHSGGIAIPLFFRLHRTKSICPPCDYKKKTELAVELLALAKEAWPDRDVTISVDSEYSCKPVLSALPERFELVGRFGANSVLLSPEVPASRGNRPRIWGDPIGNPGQLAADEEVPWETTSVWIYGRDVEMKTKRISAVWKSAGPNRTLSVVVTRDPKGRQDDGYFFSTRREADSQEVVEDAADRWSQEVCFRESKQHLGLEGVCNGFARRRMRGAVKVAGPDNEPKREAVATKRTVPMGLLVYGLVVVWYLENGQPEQDIARVKRQSPWWRHKRTVTFADMLSALRRQFWMESYSLTSYSSVSPDRLTPKQTDAHDDEHHQEHWAA